MPHITIPSIGDIAMMASVTPAYMVKTLNPHAVVYEGLLDDETCDHIVEHLMYVEPYEYTGCGATTRECPELLHSLLEPIMQFTLDVNHEFWDFDVKTPGAWLQTYEAGGYYQLHSDAEIGQSRKLTTIALLSDPNDYEGGELRLIAYPIGYDLPRTRGTLVTFPAWLLHEVLPISSGLRQTINLGYWGPPFR